MNINEIIIKFINQNKKVLEFLDNEGRVYDEVDINRYLEEARRTNFNPVLCVDFIESLLYTKNRNFSGEIDGTQIERLFESLIEIQPFNIDFYFEYAHYLASYSQKADKAKEIIEFGKKEIAAKSQELERLEQWIKNK